MKILGCQFFAYHLDGRELSLGMNAIIFRAARSILLFLISLKLQHCQFPFICWYLSPQQSTSCSQYRIPMMGYVEKATLSKNQDSQFRSWEENSEDTCQGWAVSSFLFSIHALLCLTHHGKALCWYSELCTMEYPEGIGTKKGRTMSTSSGC